ncbi:hypothetical protein PLEOSDRAFT_1108672 [Pleurotus ostreatus PC15]|uniref:F-box domain-containing protein n=1 Tax=Pleurotus ostreatus (strain PC15) TaxID=1137138 RepID=A0A067N5C0_PLEO1|nr:hypothetical protein PLEOSDRAFT_1108672 [Pleurotus ostreatus PC15]
MVQSFPEQKALTQSSNGTDGHWPLPIELIHAIIAIICSNGGQASSNLAACSLVCRSWADVCRLRIFEILLFLNSRNITSRLSFLPFTAPHLSDYVQSLSLNQSIPMSPFPAWTPECFCRLTSLRALILGNPGWAWSGFSGPLARDIETLLAAPRLEMLELKGWDFRNNAQALRCVFSVCVTSLQTLTLTKVKGMRFDVHDIPTIHLPVTSLTHYGYPSSSGPNITTTEFTLIATGSALLCWGRTT